MRRIRHEQPLGMRIPDTWTTIFSRRTAPPGEQAEPRMRNPVARRVVQMLLISTIVPLAMFIWMGQGLLSYEAEQTQRMRVADENRQYATLVHQRLLSARAALATAAAFAPSRDALHALPVPGAVLQGLAHFAPSGQLIAGEGATGAHWQRGGEGADGALQRQTIRWSTDVQAAAGSSSRVVIYHATPDGSFWLAEVAPAFLWARPFEESDGFFHCVTDTHGRVLHCPDAALHGEMASPGRADAAFLRIRRDVSLQPAFGGGRWQIRTAADRAAIAEAGSGPLLLRGVVAGIVVTLLLAGLSGWIHLRRTTAPLQSLLQGTRRLASQEWSTRVELSSDDEFGRLAASINTMAERIDRQMQAVQVQSAIDREILGRLDTGRVMRLVVDRLQALMPQARVAVVIVDLACEHWRAYRPGEDPPMAVPAGDVPALAPGQFAAQCGEGQPVPAWAARALGAHPGAVAVAAWVPAVWQGQLMALMAVGGEPAARIADDLRQEIEELRDRIAVTLAAAARESALLERAVHDSLTGLYNRPGLHEAMDRQLGRGEAFTLVLVDLDRFKEVNDTLGHQAGDELLCAVAGRLRSCVSAEAVLARPGGDEFVLLLPGPPGEATAAALAICTEIAQPFALRGVRQQIGASVGLAAYPMHGQSRGELMRRADMAMYAAKSAGRGRLSWYEDSLDARIAKRAWMLQELRRAIDQSQFVLHFQPRVDAHTGRIVCAEVLLRWQHPERGLILPDEFIPAAEETGLIDRLGPWVLVAAMRHMAAWRMEGLNLPRVAVNVSARQLRAPGFAESVLDLLHRHGLSGDDLEIELTESLFAGDSDAVINGLQPLRDAGVLVALDDFGTGYSSLSSLYRLPVDVIKIDRSFVCDLGSRPSADSVARSIVALAKALRKRVVAEGVETRSQRDHLLRLDCDELQGFLYHRPMTAADLQQRVREAEALPPPGKARR